jgi:hypothetical protein
MRIAPLSPSDIISMLQTHLTPYVQAKGGYVSIADDDLNLLEILTESPKGFRVILHWNGDTPDPDQGDLDGIADQHLEVIVTQAKGLRAKPGQELITGRAGQQPLYVLVSQIRARVRAYHWPDGATFGEIHYRGIEPVIHPDGLPFRAKRIKFDLKAAIPVEDGAVAPTEEDET